jgi:hypothetical protein
VPHVIVLPDDLGHKPAATPSHMRMIRHSGGSPSNHSLLVSSSFQRYTTQSIGVHKFQFWESDDHKSRNSNKFKWNVAFSRRHRFGRFMKRGTHVHSATLSIIDLDRLISYIPPGMAAAIPAQLKFS